MAALRPYQWYPKADVDDIILNNPGAIEAIQLKGYVLQFEPENDRFRFVRQQDTGFTDKTYTGYFEDPDPIVKRNPLKRVESLLLRFVEDCKATGRVPGLSDQQIRDILGPQWTDGRLDITVEEVKTVAAWFITDAEAKREAANLKRTTRI